LHPFKTFHFGRISQENACNAAKKIKSAESKFYESCWSIDLSGGGGRG
jgi:hypothetical protein